MKFTIGLFLLISIFSTMEAQVGTDWVKVQDAVSRKMVRNIEKTFDLENQGSGWMKQDGLMIPRFNFSCYQPLNLEQARELYSQVISILYKEVKDALTKKGIAERDYESIPVKFMLNFAQSPSGVRFSSPNIALITNVRREVIFHEYEKGFKEIGYEFEWNLVKDLPEEEYEWRKERYLAKKSKNQRPLKQAADGKFEGIVEAESAQK